MMPKQLTGNAYTLNYLFCKILSAAMNAYHDMTRADDDTTYRVERAKYTTCLDFLSIGERGFEGFYAAFQNAVKTYEETDKSDFFDHFMGAPRATDFFRSYFEIESED